jgi:hypothetical protein
MFEPRNVVLNIDGFAEMEIRPKMGMSCLRLIYNGFFYMVCRRTEIYLEPQFVVQTFVEFSEISEWLGQRYEDIWMQFPGRYCSENSSPWGTNR